MSVSPLSAQDLRVLAGAALLALGVLVLLELARWLIERAAGRAARGALPTSLRAVPSRIAARTRFPILVVVALYAGTLALGLPPDAARAARVAAVVAVLLQCAYWGGELIGFWAERLQARASEQGVSGGVATAFALRFMGSLILWVVLVLLALENAGVEITTLVAGLGIGGIAIALAAQSVLADFFASLAIVLDRPFVVGDFIVVDSLRGTVERVGIKTTRVRSLDGEQLIFPNSDLVRSRIRNFGRLQERRVEATFRLAPSTSAEAVEESIRIMRSAISAQPLARLDRAHFTGVTDGAPSLEAVYYVRSADFSVHMDIQQTIQLELLRAFAAAGIALAGVPPIEAPTALEAPATST